MNKKIERILLEENIEYSEIEEFIYFSKELRSLEINKEFSDNINKASEQRQNEISNAIKDLEAYQRKIERITSNYIKKISNKKTIKLIIKEHVKSSRVSQTMQIEMLASICADIVTQVCNHLLENKYNDELIDLLLETMTLDKYLKQEFVLFMQTLYKESIEPFGFNPLLEDHVFMFVDACGQYLISLYLNINDLDEKKQTIHQILNYSNDEIIEKRNQKRKRDEEYTQYFEKESQLFRQEQLNEIMDELKDSDFLENFTEEEINEGLQKLLKDDFKFSGNEKEILQMYEKYYNYKDTANYAEYVFEVGPLHYEHKNIKEEKIEYYLVYYLTNTLNKYLKSNELDKVEDKYADALLCLFMQQFMNLLAYYIHSTNKFDENKKREMIQEFVEILLSNPSCKEHYNNEVESNITKNILYTFTPIDTYYNRIISSVLYELGDREVSKKVVNILNKYYGERVSIKESIEKETEKFEETPIEKLIQKYDVNQFAISFIHYYLEDKVYLASYCPFVRVVKNLLLDDAILSEDNQVDICRKLLTKEEKNPKVYKELNDANKLLKNIVNKSSKLNLHLDEDESIFTSLMILPVKRYDFDHFMNMNRLEIMLDKYEYEMTLQLCNYLRSPYGKNFEKRKLEDQVKVLYRMIISNELLNGIENYKYFIPTLEDMEKDELIKQLIKENEHLKRKLGE